MNLEEANKAREDGRLYGVGFTVDGKHVDISRVVMFTPKASGVTQQYRTEDAYLRACKALHWRTAELKANGIDPVRITDDMPYYAPDDYDFGVSGKQSDREVAIGEHAFKAGFEAGQDYGEEASYTTKVESPEVDRAWSEYTPPEFD